MSNYKDVGTILEAYHQLARGKSLTRIKAAANRLRSRDPANEMLPELDAKIETMNETARAVGFSGHLHDRHQAAEMPVRIGDHHCDAKVRFGPPWIEPERSNPVHAA